MKRQKRETSREYLMKLIYQTHIVEGDITDLKSELDDFLENNEEFIVEKYRELTKDETEGLNVDRCVDKQYLIKMCNVIAEKIDYINQLIDENAINWSIDRFAKVDLSILQVAIAEMLSDLNIPNKVSINEAINISKVYCEDKTPKFINGILGSVVNEISAK